mmetsp:Transcript_23636/g.72714  ORF Transcript_23636/g.72714 Transcript_23636/m.72714 type:complete len:340 (-) Transcript_23636:1151-2170(-)
MPADKKRDTSSSRQKRHNGENYEENDDDQDQNEGTARRRRYLVQSNLGLAGDGGAGAAFEGEGDGALLEGLEFLDGGHEAAGVGAVDLLEDVAEADAGLLGVDEAEAADHDGAVFVGELEPEAVGADLERESDDDRQVRLRRRAGPAGGARGRGRVERRAPRERLVTDRRRIIRGDGGHGGVGLREAVERFGEVLALFDDGRIFREIRFEFDVVVHQRVALFLELGAHRRKDRVVEAHARVVDESFRRQRPVGFEDRGHVFCVRRARHAVRVPVPVPQRRGHVLLGGLPRTPAHAHLVLFIVLGRPPRVRRVAVRRVAVVAAAARRGVVVVVQILRRRR